MLNPYLCKAMTTLRNKKRLSQSTAASRAGVSNSNWSLWENGDRAPKDDAIRQICQGLGCSRFELEMTINQLHTEDLTEQAARLGAAPPAQNTSELVARAERLMKLDLELLPDDLHRPFNTLRNFGVILSTQYQPLMDSFMELYLLTRRAPRRP